MLFIAPSYMDIYKDVIEELNNQGYYVDYIETKDYKQDPYNKRGYKKLRRLLLVHEKRFFEWNKKRWENILSQEPYQGFYDLLFVIDGQAIHPVIVTILRQRNPALKSFNYLFDTTTGIYQFDKNFFLFDKVYTFDLQESKKYNILHLPIYWMSSKEEKDRKYYKVFALGRYNKNRYDLFNLVKDCIASEADTYIKLQVTRTNIIKNRIKELLSRFWGLSPVDVPTSFYKDEMVTYDSFSPDEFRSIINNSDTIIDTSAPHQDGLTARFMWALGAEKKIITSNPVVREYSFYSEEQIFVIDSLQSVDKHSLVRFINGEYKMDLKTREEISKYHISNWIKTIFLS